MKRNFEIDNSFDFRKLPSSILKNPRAVKRIRGFVAILFLFVVFLTPYCPLFSGMQALLKEQQAEAMSNLDCKVAPVPWNERLFSQVPTKVEKVIRSAQTQFDKMGEGGFHFSNSD